MTRRKEFTDTKLRALECPPGKGQIYVRDPEEPSLDWAIFESGKISFTHRGKDATGKRKRWTFGEYPTYSMKAARERVREAVRLIDKGKDPLAQREGFWTVRQAFEERQKLPTARFGISDLRSLRQMKVRFETKWPCDIQEMDINEYSNSHLKRMINPLLDQGLIEMARKLYSDVTGLMAFTLDQGKIEFSKIGLSKRPKKGARKRPKVYLTLAEIKKLWEDIDDALGEFSTVGYILKLMLLTGCRCVEVAGLQACEIDFGRRIWTVPKDRVKNKRDHVVPLNDLALEIMRVLVRRNTRFLLAGSVRDRKLSTSYIGRQIKDMHTQGLIEVQHFTSHVMRRTVVTQCSLNKYNGLKIAHQEMPHIVNHQSAIKKKNDSDRDADGYLMNRDVLEAHYDCNEFLTEKRNGLNQWGDFMKKVISGDPATMALDNPDADLTPAQEAQIELMAAE